MTDTPLSPTRLAKSSKSLPYLFQSPPARDGARTYSWNFTNLVALWLRVISKQCLLALCTMAGPKLDKVIYGFRWFQFASVSDVTRLTSSFFARRFAGGVWLFSRSIG